MTIQAYLDDSGMGQPPAAVLGGFVATAASWTVFSDEWQQALDMRPSIAYFKMNEANSLRGEFEYWSESRRNERVALLFSIIEKHALIGVTTAVPHDLYRSIFCGRLDKNTEFLEYPYFLLFLGATTSIAQHFTETGRREAIEFIFDSQPDQMNRMLAGWELFVSVSPDELKPLLERPPIFRGDKKALPLQAADLHAWWTRRMFETAFSGKAQLTPPLPGNQSDLKVRMLEMFWTQDRLERMYHSLSGSIPISLRPSNAKRAT
jgi:hypothetical protein